MMRRRSAARVADRPKPGTGSHEVIAMNRAVAACDNLRPTIIELKGVATQDYRDVIYWAECDKGSQQVHDFAKPFVQT